MVMGHCITERQQYTAWPICQEAVFGGEKKLVKDEEMLEAIAPNTWPHRQRYHQGYRQKVVAKSSNFSDKANCSTDNTLYHNWADCQKMPETLANSLGMRVVNLGEKLGKG